MRETSMRSSTQDQGRRNLAAALGGWSARHRKTAVFGWLLFVVLASLIGGAAGQKKLTDAQQGAGGSAQALKMLEDAGIARPASEMVMITGTGQSAGTADAAQFKATVHAVMAGVQGTGRVQNMHDPYAVGLISADKRS